MIFLNSFEPKIIAIVPAAGIGSRMKLKFPKQYLKIQKYTIIEHVLKILLLHPNITRIIVSLHEKDNFFKRLPISSDVRIISVVGGKNRINSVFSGLKIKTDANWVIIHDAVRPCLNYQDLDRLISTIKKNPVGTILAKPVSDTIKKIDKKSKKILYTVDRSDLWHALTPQLFQIHLLRKCLKKIIMKKINITDEASALEYYGYHPLFILGSSLNIKITWKEDLDFAEFYLKNINKT